MKGSQLNDRRWDILNTLEKQLEEAMNSLRAAKNDYHRFDTFDEYRNDYYAEFVKKGLDAEIALTKLIEFLDE